MPDTPETATGGGRNVRFEETLSIRDGEGANSLITVTRVLVAFLAVSTLVSVLLVVGSGTTMFVDVAGGTDAALAFVEGALSGWSPVGGFLLAVVGSIVVGLLMVAGFLRQLGRAFDEQVHVRVTDAGVTVQREGSRRGQCSGVEIPFDAITAVEYADPEESSTRIELGDWRAPKFFAGRSGDWVRIERGDGPAVYVGSDRPTELAETVARSAPAVENATPF